MSRPLRLQYSGALYHVMARGNAQLPIFHDDHDRIRLLDVLATVGARHDWQVLAYCLMNNHYHLVLETPTPSLARGMRDVNGRYAQWFNWRHRRVGHVFQGRYRSILVDGDAYFQELLRYVALNPVRARLCRSPSEWPWSSHRAMCGSCSPPSFLKVERGLSFFDRDRERAMNVYRTFVSDMSGCGEDRYQPTGVVLGPAPFRAQALAKVARSAKEVPRRERRLPLGDYQRRFPDPDAAMHAAYSTGLYTLTEIGRHFRLHYSTVSKRVRERGQVLP